MLRNGTPTWEQSIDAALRYAGKDALVTGMAGARLHGLTKAPQTNVVHLLITEPRQRLSSGFVLVERTTRLPSSTTRLGFPTADVTRAVLDAARRMRNRPAVEALLAEAVQRGRTTPQRLWKELNAGSIRGSALPREVLSAIADGARSTAEARAADLASRSGLPRMMLNPELRTSGGLLLPSPDGWIDEVGLAWEIDSYDWHLAPEDYRRTLWRHNVLTAHGIIVVHTIPSRLATEPDQVLDELRAAYRHATQRPRPDVIARSIRAA